MGRIKSVTLLDLVNRFPFVAAVLHALVYSVVDCFSCEVHVTLFGAFRHTNFEDFAVGLNCSDSALEVLHLELFNNYQFIILLMTNKKFLLQITLMIFSYLIKEKYWRVN